MAKIFISYRREDSQDTSGRIYDHLTRRFGKDNVFKDVFSISPGELWPTALEEALTDAGAVLVVIGPGWLKVQDEAGRRRLDVRRDPVRQEIEAALDRACAHKVKLIPVLVQDATLPPVGHLPKTIRRLTSFQAKEVRRDPDFPRDMERLIQSLPSSFTSMPHPSPTATTHVDVAGDISENVEDLLEVGSELVEHHHFGPAISFLVRATQLAPDDSKAWYRLGEAYEGATYYEGLDRLEDALAAYSRVAELSPNDPRAWISKADVLYGLAEDEEALTAVDQGLQVLDSTTRTEWEKNLWLEKARLLRQLGREAEADEADRSANEAPPKVVSLAELAELGFKDAGMTESASDLVNKGEDLVSQQKYAEAMPLFERAAQLELHNSEVWANLGLIYYHVGQPKLSLAACEHALALDDTHAWVWHNKGVALESLDRLAQALEAYRRAAELDPGDHQTAFKWAQVQDKLRRSQ